MKKFAFIGGGSFGFTRKLVKDLLTFPAFADAEIALDKANNNTARIVGIAVIAVAIAAVTAVTVIKRKRRAV